ncbi:unnamed protein product [Blepharisma stoltei]|uniref:Uncharacterized protein n=1 Tax=Blepharisma stoltei TaxID=1481888 RepID=A0AAU9ITH5_9CILI|nr:unnamed protein product [Blepharisma stoltei]
MNKRIASKNKHARNLQNNLPQSKLPKAEPLICLENPGYFKEVREEIQSIFLRDPVLTLQDLLPCKFKPEF